MKIPITLLFILIFSLCVFGQSKSDQTKSQNVKIEITNDGATSELLPIGIGMTPNLSDAKIGIKYFGVDTVNDISVVLILKGTKFLYSSGESFGVKIFVDGVPLKANKYRLIDAVDKGNAEEILHFYITTEELAWLATADKLSISIFNTESDKKHDMLTFTPTKLKELKDFAKSVFLIRSQF